MFRGLILNHFSDWDQTSRSWKRIKWSEHADRLEPWLKSVRANRDTRLAQRLLRWKYSGKNWGIDAKPWCAALLHDYTTAPSSAARATVLEEYDDWFQLDEDTAVEMYRCDSSCGKFLLKHFPQSTWGGDKRKLWQRLG